MQPTGWAPAHLSQAKNRRSPEQMQPPAETVTGEVFQEYDISPSLQWVRNTKFPFQRNLGNSWNICRQAKSGNSLSKKRSAPSGARSRGGRGRYSLGCWHPQARNFDSHCRNPGSFLYFLGHSPLTSHWPVYSPLWRLSFRALLLKGEENIARDFSQWRPRAFLHPHSQELMKLSWGTKNGPGR